MERMRMAFGGVLSRHMDSTPSELLHRYEGFRDVGILGDEESGEMKRELLWIEDMWRYFGKICNWKLMDKLDILKLSTYNR